MNHSECQKMLMEIGKKLKFSVFRKTRGDLYRLANADCVWYYQPDSRSVGFFEEMAKDDNYTTIPVVAFEVANSEQEKALRGSVSSLQILNASVSVIVLIGKSVDKHDYLKSLLKKFALGRVHIWAEDDVAKWYAKIVDGSPATPDAGGGDR